MTHMSKPCPVCSGKASFERRHPDAVLYRCPDCRHCFSDLASIGQFEDYGPDYYEGTHERWFSQPHTVMHGRILELVRRYKPEVHSLLDVGCGNGNFLRFVRDRGFCGELMGLDLNLNEAEPNIEYLGCDFLACNLERRYDVLISIAVIEHVAEVGTFVDKIREHAKQDALAVVITLNDQSVLYRVARMLAGIGFRAPFERLYDVHHLNHFNTTSLSRLVELSGGEVLFTESFGPPLSVLDVPAPFFWLEPLYRLVVWGLLSTGQVVGQNFLQTIVYRPHQKLQGG